VLSRNRNRILGDISATRAVIWRNGIETDLNTLIDANSDIHWL
jgi:hypothetical protein